MTGVPFTPQGMYVLVQVPEEFYLENSKIIINDSTKKSKRMEYAQKGDKMIVAATGEGCVFTKVGDKVSINCRGAMELKLDGIDEPFFIVRESEILGRFD